MRWTLLLLFTFSASAGEWLSGTWIGAERKLDAAIARAGGAARAARCAKSWRALNAAETMLARLARDPQSARACAAGPRGGGSSRRRRDDRRGAEGGGLVTG